MKKLHTIIAMVALVVFGLLFAAFDNSSPPTSAENVQFTHDVNQTVNAETAQTVQADFDVGISNFQTRATKITANEASFTGDIPIANSRRTEIKTLLSVISEVRNKPPERYDSPSGEFTDIANTRFSGFGVENFARAKVWSKV